MAAEPGTDHHFQAIELAGRAVRLVPMRAEHLDALTAAGADPEIWKWYSVNGATPETMRAFVDDALEGRRKGTAVPFAVLEAASGAIVGSTRFGAIERRHKPAEIGWTFLAPRCQRTGINTEMKYLMLRHAFEAWGLQRVEFKTDALNDKSRNALRRIGATEEGVLRRHMVTFTGRVRDSVYYSVTDGDWPRVKRHLEQLMNRAPHPGPLPAVAGRGDAVS
jgi:RimJ/RimL family protein N-acetyltransferase